MNLTVDPKSIDINIHPTKTEIKFDDEHTLYALLRSAIKHSLGQFNIAPVLDFDRDNNLDTPYNYQQKVAQKPNVEIDRAFNPFREENNPSNVNHSYKKENTNGWESLYVGLESKGNSNSGDFDELHFESENEERTEAFLFIPASMSPQNNGRRWGHLSGLQDPELLPWRGRQDA